MIAGVHALLAAYRAGRTTPAAVIEELIPRLQASAPGIWISRVDDAVLRERAAMLMSVGPDGLPLYGIPFAIKDNIDLEGQPTTAACPAFSYRPPASATVVQRLLDAGAIALGKTNLDQFATGLVGTRSPYGVCANAFDADYISGGSSSGSAVAVAQGLAAFALGTDTAGSGRVPAAFNNLVGYKPTRGLLSTQGVVAACRTLDAVSVFALTAADAALVGQVAAGFDAGDPFSRPQRASPRRGWSRRQGCVAVPRADQLEFFGNDEYARLFACALEALRALGHPTVEVDIGPLLETARLLYEGPWVAERHLTAGALIAAQPQAVLPVIRDIIGTGATPSARDAFAAQYRLQALRRASEGIWNAAEVLVLPTAGTHDRIDAVLADPVRLNSRLGHYTNFVNLLDLAAVAVPAGFTRQGLSFGVTLVAGAFEDADLLQMAARLQAHTGDRAGALDGAALSLQHPPDEFPDLDAGSFIDVAVCGAHMDGLPLNGQLTSRGAWRVATTHTAAIYRLYALAGGPPHRPGLLRVAQGGAAIEIEIWRLPREHFADFVAAIPAPLGIGRLRVADGSEVCGFLCEAAGTDGALDITASGGWRAYLRSLDAAV